METREPNNRTPLLEARELSRRLSDDRLVFENVSLAIHSKDRWAIQGPTGSGKTLLLRCLALLDPADSGQVLWNGQTIAKAEVPSFRHSNIYLHQTPSLLEGDVGSNLEAPFAFQQHHQSTYNEERIVAWLTQLGFSTTFLKAESGNLSGGERQVVSLLRALQLSPTILLLDEATVALDENTTLKVESLVNDWVGEEGTSRATVWVSHSEEQLKRVSDESMWLAK